MFTLLVGDLYKVQSKYLEHLVQEKYQNPNFKINITSNAFVELDDDFDIESANKLLSTGKCTASNIGLILNLLHNDKHIYGSYIYVVK